MNNIVSYKQGVLFTVIAAGGFRILSAIQQATTLCQLDLTITSACDGEHSGPDDPHHRGEAYDIRTHDFTKDQKDDVLSTLMKILGDQFYGFIEDPETENEHIHVQVKKGTVYE